MTQRILVVEDSRTQAERLRLVLAGEGYEVEVAFDGRQGLERAQSNGADLVISDVTMPEMDGFEFCRAMKASSSTHLIPIILLTTRTTPTDIMQGLESGADNFIPKSNDDEYLLERVRRIFVQLEQRKQHHLEMEVNLTLGGRRITVTADRQQIMELLFSTFEQMGRHHDELACANHELQEARAEADRANRAKSQFLSRMSHELRTPLNAIMGFGQLLELAPLEPRDRESAHLIVAAGRHLLDLINEVLDIGRIDAEELDLSLEAVPADDVLAEAMDLMQLLAVERGVEVSTDFAGCELCVMADRQRLKQVILNLLSNAIKYNRPGGSVTVSCRKGGDGSSRIEVTDAGPGIAPENLERLFAPFDRIDAARDSDVEGSGLGLALSKRLVEAMGGILGVQSELDRGSTFWLELPAVDEHAGAGAAQAVPTGGTAADEARTRVLLHVDDNVVNLRLVEQILAHRPEITLIEATHGRPGLDLARQHRPDMILLDLQLPDISGEDVLEQLRADPATREIPVVIATVSALPERVQDLRSIGADAYLTKPLDVRQFLQIVDEVLTRRPSGAHAEGSRST